MEVMGRMCCIIAVIISITIAPVKQRTEEIVREVEKYLAFCAEDFCYRICRTGMITLQDYEAFGQAFQNAGSGYSYDIVYAYSYVMWGGDTVDEQYETRQHFGKDLKIYYLPQLQAQLLQDETIRLKKHCLVQFVLSRKSGERFYSCGGEVG